MCIFSDSMLMRQNAQKLDVSKLFATTLFTGTGAAQTIVNGLDLAGKGGLSWYKGRSTTISHNLIDSVRTPDFFLRTNQQATGGRFSVNGLVTPVFNGNGLKSSDYGEQALSGVSFVNWSFARSPRFFDIIAWTGNGVPGRSIAHSLARTPGLIIIKAVGSGTGRWHIWHTSAAGALSFSADTQQSSQFGVTGVSSSDFTVSNNYEVNESGIPFVAYVFADDQASDGIVQCSWYTISGGANANVNLGWEPQFLMTKCIDAGSVPWLIKDTARGWPATGAPSLLANSNDVEVTSQADFARTSTGFIANGPSHPNDGKYVFVAIRKAGS